MANILGTFRDERFDLLGTWRWNGFTWVLVSTNRTTDGRDTVNAGGGNDSVGAGGGNDVINGEVGNDTLVGGTGADTLSGGEGNDLLYGGLQRPGSTGDGNDQIRGGAGNDTAYGGDGDDTLGGDDGNDHLFGEAGNDSLSGGSGQDVLTGGVGADRLSGGAGGDVFRLDAVSDSAAAANGAFDARRGDVVLDFTSVAETAITASQDKIDLRGLTTSLGVSLSFSGTQPARWGVWYTTLPSSRTTVVRMDTDGNGIADVAITLNSIETLSASDFLGLAAGDNTAPTVLSTAFGGNDGSLKAGETVSIVLSFSEPVIVSGGLQGFS